MDLIYMNSSKEDIGVLHDYNLDLAFGTDENNFECRIHSASHCCEPGYFLYVEGTEYGGVIDTIESRTEEQEIVYSGRTWHGILGSKVVLPLQSGETSSSVTIKETDSLGNSLVNRYLIISGDANACLQFLVDRIGVADMFTATTDLSAVQINQFQFNRFTDAYNGIVKMLSSAGLKLKIEFKNGKAVLSAVLKYDYSQDEEFDSDQVALRVKKRYKTVNHLVCLGKGELENRQVIHLFADEDGNVSRTQTLFGMDEITATYDYSSVESEEELESSGTETLKSLWIRDELSINFDEESTAYDVGDVIGGVDNVTGIAVSSNIAKKVVYIKNGQITIDLYTSELSTSGSWATGDGSTTGGESSGSDDTEEQPSEGESINVAEVLQTVYPVGSIYMSINSASPDTLFGFGTWEAIQDTFLLASGTTYEAGTTGGAATHTLSEDEMPSHTHTAHSLGVTYSSTSSSAYLAMRSATASNQFGDTTYTAETGGGGAHNNMPPYLAVYMWKRTA